MIKIMIIMLIIMSKRRMLCDNLTSFYCSRTKVSLKDSIIKDSLRESSHLVSLKDSFEVSLSAFRPITN